MSSPKRKIEYEVYDDTSLTMLAEIATEQASDRRNLKSPTKKKKAIPMYIAGVTVTVTNHRAIDRASAGQIRKRLFQVPIDATTIITGKVLPHHLLTTSTCGCGKGIFQIKMNLPIELIGAIRFKQVWAKRHNRVVAVMGWTVSSQKILKQELSTVTYMVTAEMDSWSLAGLYQSIKQNEELLFTSTFFFNGHQKVHQLPYNITAIGYLATTHTEQSQI